MYLGSPTGLLTEPHRTAESNLTDGNLGYSVASAADVNADGYDDPLVGAPDYGHGEQQEGIVVGFFGGTH